MDTVLLTYSLCTIPDPVAALEGMARVLRPGGELIFCEHGMAPDANCRKWQDRLNPFWVRFADGCNMNRPIDRFVEDAGFRPVSLERFRHDGPAALAQMFRGVSERAS